MFSSYSWTEHISTYLVTVVVLCVLYYCYVMYRYFPKERKALFSRNGEKTDNEDGYTQDSGHAPGGEEAYSNEVSNAINESEALMGMIKRLVSDSVTQNYTRSDLLMYLKGTFQQFPDLNEPSFRLSVNEFVVAECESRGSILLKEEEVDLLWD